jgi:hypothetical protein
MRTFRYPTAAVAAGAILGITVLSASPASANVSEGYGRGRHRDRRLGDEGALSQNSHARVFANGLWQWVLYAEGATAASLRTADPVRRSPCPR